MKNTTLKLVVSTVKKNIDAKGSVIGEEIVFYPTINQPWSTFTPAGRLEFTVTNPEVMGTFLPGQIVMADLSIQQQ